MLGFNPNTQPVAMKEWVTPLDPSIYAQGVANQTKKLEAQSAQDSELYNSFMNIQAIAPQDEEQLQNLKQSFEKELSGLSMGDLRNPQTKAQLSQIQNKYTNLLLESGIPQRTQKYKKDIQEVKDLEAKGKFVPAWKMKPIIEAQKYIQDGNFYKDTRFNGQIQAGFDWDKHNKSLLDSTPEYHELKKGKQTNDLYQGKTYNSLYSKFFEGLNQPGALDDLREQFEYKYGNEDFASQDYNTAIEQVNRLTKIRATSNNPILVEQAKKDLDYWDDFSKSVNSQISKEDAFQRYIRANAEDFARTNTNYALKESKINDVYKMQQDHAHAQAMKTEKESLAMYGIKKAIDATIASGKTPDYEAIENGDYSSLVYNPVESRDGKSGIKTVTTPETKILIGAKEYKVADAEANIIAGSKEFIKEALESYYEPLEKDEDIEINGDDIYYEKKGISGSNSTGWDKHITKQQLINKIKGSQPSSNKPNSTNYVKKAQLGDGTLVYSNDGNTYYDDKGNEYDNQGNKK